MMKSLSKQYRRTAADTLHANHPPLSMNLRETRAAAAKPMPGKHHPLFTLSYKITKYMPNKHPPTDIYLLHLQFRCSQPVVVNFPIHHPARPAERKCRFHTTKVPFSHGENGTSILFLCPTESTSKSPLRQDSVTLSLAIIVCSFYNFLIYSYKDTKQ